MTGYMPRLSWGRLRDPGASADSDSPDQHRGSGDRQGGFLSLCWHRLTVTVEVLLAEGRKRPMFNMDGEPIPDIWDDGHPDSDDRLHPLAIDPLAPAADAPPLRFADIVVLVVGIGFLAALVIAAVELVRALAAA